MSCIPRAIAGSLVGCVLLRRDGDVKGIGAKRLRSTVLVEHIDLGDREAGSGQQVGDRTCQMTSTEDTLLDRFEPVLPALNVLVGSETVLDEMQRPTRLEHPAHLRECHRNVRDGAQRPRRQRAVTTVIGQRQRLAIDRHQIPLTYRDEPLEVADDALIVEMEHSVLGNRWVYDGLRDPRLVVMLAAVAMTGQGEALGMAVYDGRWYIAPSNVRIQGGGWTQERVPVDGFELEDANTPGAVLRNERFELTVFRRPVPGPRPPIGLTATWDGATQPRRARRGQGTLELTRGRPAVLSTFKASARCAPLGSRPVGADRGHTTPGTEVSGAARAPRAISASREKRESRRAPTELWWHDP